MVDIPVMRKTRFVCILDTHNASPGGAFQLPKGDVLIHAGDMTNQGSFKELQKTVNWIEESDFECKIVIAGTFNLDVVDQNLKNAGNHDITLDTDFYAQFGLYFHNQEPQDSKKCQELLERSHSILWLKHESGTIKLASPTGPRTSFKLFGSPFSPAKGMWAFGYDPDEASQIWNKIPLDTDIVVTHTPAKYHCDETKERRAAGCTALRETLWRVRPRLAICGHIHEGRDVERVRWDLGAPNIKYKEWSSEPWVDPGGENKKLSLVDLTRKHGAAIENDGSIGDTINEPVAGQSKATLPTIVPTIPQQIIEGSMAGSKRTAKVGLSRIVNSVLAIPPEAMPPATRGQGGMPPSLRCDLEALSGRLGRKETCFINAAIMASSWPHGGGGKKFNKPIVVDVDLPVWDR
ncbi:putative rhamnogalacturonate lyase C [Hyphodiscus hymeniophilus]|uniref:Rhamnogalacturonate lyase C n=1 Tax=Hyphodiscus hymeniophilus TaxID=353542 RepID=A0A9P6VFG1_9HELO|nr:putative rhamnogalacturonate lyase C [Hyphodiscus hymeniophilus]